MQIAKLKISKEYVQWVYSYLIQVSELEAGYTEKRLAFLMKYSPSFLKDTLSFEEYKAVDSENFIIEDLEERVDFINNQKDELDTIEFDYEVTPSDIDYFYKAMKKTYSEYLPYIFDEHVATALVRNPKAFMTLKAELLEKDDYFKRTLISDIQYQLVGRLAPAPCANNKVKSEYYALFKDLKMRK